MKNFSLTEIIFGVVFLVGIAVVVNSQFGLGVRFLTDIELAITPGGGNYEEDLGIDYATASDECKSLMKVFGDNKRVMRQRILQAEEEGKDYEVEQLKEQLKGMAVDIKSRCG
jgi:hypothetical protein